MDSRGVNLVFDDSVKIFFSKLFIIKSIVYFKFFGGLFQCSTGGVALFLLIFSLRTIDVFYIHIYLEYKDKNDNN